MVSADHVWLAVVVRFSRYDTDDPRQLIDLKEAFNDHEEAEREVQRLNELVADKEHIQYFVLSTRYFSTRKGRASQVLAPCGYQTSP
jgi:hypothetical protein